MKKNIFSKKDISLLPIGFQFFEKLPKTQNKRQVKPKFFEIKKYQTPKYQLQDIINQ